MHEDKTFTRTNKTMPNLTTEINTFLNSCQQVLSTRHATEHSYRKSLEILLGAVNNSLKVLNEPKRQKVGAPDFILFRNGVQIGFRVGLINIF